MTEHVQYAALLLGTIGHLWAFALAPRWVRERGDGWLAHAKVVVGALAVVSVATWLAGWLWSGPAARVPRSCYAIEPAGVCRTHVADILTHDPTGVGALAGSVADGRR